MLRPRLIGSPLLALALTPPASAQQLGEPPPKAAQPAQDEIVDVPKVIVVPPHEETFGTPAIRTESVTADHFTLDLQSRVLPDALKELPAVQMQRTGLGQASPFLRGFTGFRTLYVLDGFRFNNSTWRDGPNQYFSTIDSYLIDHLDVRFGSGSVRYGSDAVGGTVVMETRAAGSAIPDKDWSATFATRWASAERSATQHVDVGGNLPEGIAYTVGGTWRDQGDLSGGRHVGTQEGTGYDEGSADAKLAWRLADQSEIVVAHQRERTFDAPRTHATIDGFSWHGTTVGTDKVREFDQFRDFTYSRLDWREGGFFDRVRAGLGYHSQEEAETRVRSNSTRIEQGVDVDTLSAFLNFEKSTAIGRWLFGGDWSRDDVHSYQENYNASGALTGIAIQGPVGDNSYYDTTGLFAEDELDLGSSTTLTLGGRVARTSADSNSVRDPQTGAQIGVGDDWISWAADARLHHEWNSDTATWLAASRAIRVPNLSDLTRFDIALSGEIETPTPGLDPEQFTTFELGGRHDFGPVETSAAAYVTLIEDMIVRFPTGNTVNGAQEIQKANVGDGRMQGVDASALWHVDSDWSIGANASYVAGRVTTYLAPGVKDDEPLGKLPPLHGSMSVRWEQPGTTFWIEGIGAWAGRQDRLSPTDELDTQRIPPDGTPGYFVVGLRAGCSPTKRLDLALAVENATDRDYRLHGSGVNEPGTNVVASLRWRF